MSLKDWTWLSDFHFLSFGVLCFPTLSPSGYTLAGSCSGWGLGMQPICLPVPSGSLLRAAIAAWWHDVWSVLCLLIMTGNIFHPQNLLSVSSLGERVLFLPLFKKPLIPPSWWDPSSWPHLTLISPQRLHLKTPSHWDYLRRYNSVHCSGIVQSTILWNK